MSLCFNPVIRSAAHPDDPKRTLDILDFPQMIADRYHVHQVEMQHSHFASPSPITSNSSVAASRRPART